MKRSTETRLRNLERDVLPQRKRHLLACSHADEKQKAIDTLIGTGKAAANDSFLVIVTGVPRLSGFPAWERTDRQEITQQGKGKI
jgi:hypothetical protein